MNDPKELSIAEKREAYHLFHKCWGDAKSGDYHKEDWKRLKALVERSTYVEPYHF